MFGVIYDITQRHRLEAALETRVLALARPPGELGGIAFEDIFNLGDIQRLQDGFAQATGVASIIIRPDGTHITRPSRITLMCGEIMKTTAAGCSSCRTTEQALAGIRLDGPIVERCLNGGMWSAGTAISVDGHPVASWLIGQVRDPSMAPEAMSAYAREIGVDEGAFMEAYRKVPVMSAEQFHDVAHALYTLAKHLSISAHQNVQQAGLITELRQAEARNRNLAEGLEQRVLERTAQLESANRELEAFSYSVTHDLRAPLRSIDGFSRVLLEDHLDQLDADGQHQLDRIRANTERMGRLIDDLLDLSGVGRKELKLETVDLTGISGKVLRDLAEADPGRKVEGVIQPALRVKADPGLVELVLENLLRNAWKFTTRKPDPRIEVGAKDLPGGEIVFFIQDNGAGFDMAHAGKLFNAFQRLHSANDYEGTGIGLAIVQRAIHRHGGRIWAEAEPGRGAAFFFTFPGQNSPIP